METIELGVEPRDATGKGAARDDAPAGQGAGGALRRQARRRCTWPWTARSSKPRSATSRARTSSA